MHFWCFQPPLGGNLLGPPQETSAGSKGHHCSKSVNEFELGAGPTRHPLGWGRRRFRRLLKLPSGLPVCGKGSQNSAKPWQSLLWFTLAKGYRSKPAAGGGGQRAGWSPHFPVAVSSCRRRSPLWWPCGRGQQALPHGKLAGDAGVGLPAGTGHAEMTDGLHGRL